jgi:hypothetical protein
MKNVLSKSLLATGSLALALGIATRAQAQSVVVYQAGAGGGAALQAYKGPASGNGYYGFGDDYNTGFSGSILLNGLSFEGGFTGAGANDELNIDFYSTAGSFVTSITVPASQIPNTYTYLGNSLPASDFGSGVSIPGSGYVFFAPENTTGSQSAQFTLGYGPGTPTAGSSDSNAYQIADDGASITTATENYSYISTVGGFHFVMAPAPYADISLSAVPEPASLGLIATSSLLFLRRRRTV